MKKFLGILIIGGLLFNSFSFTFALGESFSEDPDSENYSVNNLSNNTEATTPKNNDTSVQNTVQWIRMNDKCLLNGQCWFNIYQFLGLRQSISDNNSPELFVQDILLSATFFIGTIVTIAFIVSWLMFIFAGATGKDPSKAKAGIKNSLIGLLIVVSSYSIIRIVQYIAKGL